MNRRQMLKTVAGAAAATIAAPMLNRGSFALFGGATTYSARAVELVKRATVIDMLNVLSLPAVLGVDKRHWLNAPETFTAADLRTVKDSGFTVMHIAVGTGGPDAVNATLRFVGAWNGFIAHHAGDFIRVDSPARLDTIKSSGRIGILIGVQNSDHFRTLEEVNTFHALGQRVSQLTYNTRNLIGNGSTERRDDGLSDFGVAIVGRMNQVGMAVDVSHCGDRTTLDAFEVSKKPVLITHSNCRTLVGNHPRCKSDEAIRKMAATGGVMGITNVRMFVRDQEPTTIEHLLDHYDHVAKLVGVEHLGVGSDIGLWGYDALPEEAQKRLKAGYKESYAFREKTDIEGVDHPKRTFNLAEGLIRRGYSDANIEAILGGNFQRVLKQIFTVEPVPEKKPA
jgi:membrane dipeptidase